VAFNTKLNREGAPSVISLAVCDESFETTPGDLSVSCESHPEVPTLTPWKGKGEKGGGKGEKGKGEKGEKGERPGKPTATGRMFSGILKSFNTSSNYGFIDCKEIMDEFGKDVFVHGMELSGYDVGDTVEFELAMSTKDQPQALIQTSVPEGEAKEEPVAKKQKKVEAAELDEAALDAALADNTMVDDEAEAGAGAETWEDEGEAA